MRRAAAASTLARLPPGRASEAPPLPLSPRRARARLSYQRARRADGSVVIWFGLGRQTGRGEGSSGLRFDALVDTGQA